jgi:hypothetical protein
MTLDSNTGVSLSVRRFWGGADARKLHLLAIAALLLTLLPALGPFRTGAQQENDPEIVASLHAINMYRKWLGIAPLTINPQLQAMAEAHVEYYRLNFGNPHLAGMGLHEELPGNPGFTGATMRDRAEYHGYSGSVNENAGISGSMFWSTEWFIGTINHRLTLIDPRYTEIGLAAVDEGDIVFEIINLGAPSWSDTAEPQWSAWPVDGSTGVGLSFWGEAPDPYPGASYPVGYPITLKYFGPDELTLESWKMSVDGAEIPSFASIGEGWLSRQTVQISSALPLEPGRTYTVNVTGQAGGSPYTHEWSFTTRSDNEPLALNGEFAPEPGDDARQPSPQPPEPTPPSTPDSSSLPPGVAEADPEVQELWWQGDGSVYTRSASRSWLWGPDTWVALTEQYTESGGGDREVYYFDKARLEVNDEEGAEHELTAGLLVRDMILGQSQIGDNEFVEIGPADVPLAGDGKRVNPNAPTYASLTPLASLDDQPNRAEEREGEWIVETINSISAVGRYPEMEGMVRYGTYEETLGHNIAAVFEQYFDTLPVDWTVSVGLPLTEPYWVETLVGGEEMWVLVQAFERRLLTFTPNNDPSWQVEMGNVGRHYYEWRYGEEPPDTDQ